MSSWRETLRTQQSLSIAAKEESDRLGHSTIDVEHLFLALLVVGGPAARVLDHAGVDLTAAREAVVAEHRDRVGSLGFDTPEIAPLDPIPDPGASDITYSPRALDVVQQPVTGRFDLGLLDHLLDEPSGLVAAALVRMEVDPGMIRVAVSDAARHRKVSQPRVVQDPSTAAYTGYVPVPLDRVWALVSDPARRVEWDSLGYQSVEVQDDGTVLTLAATKSSRGRRIWVSPGLARAQHVLTRVEPSRLVEWRTTYPDTPKAILVMTMELEPDGPGTRITIVNRRRPGPQLIWVPFSGLWRWFLRLGLAGTVSSISRALRS